MRAAQPASPLRTATCSPLRWRTTAHCTKGSALVTQDGPGNDWRCYVYWHLPGVNGATGQAVYQLDVSANGRYGRAGYMPGLPTRDLASI